MKRSEILREAKKLILSNKQYYLCFAIDDLSWKYDMGGYWKCENIKDWAITLLDGRRTLNSWLVHNYPDMFINCNDIEEEYVIVKQCRLAWIDWMIEYCEKEEAEEELNSVI